MKDRCYRENYPEFYLYGGRGIKVCDRWLNSFENFFEDMGKRPSKKYSLDRYPDMNGDYTPLNCRWATTYEQARCKRNNKWVEYNGIKMIKADWAINLGTTQQVLGAMLKKHPFDYVYNFYKSTKEERARLRGDSISKTKQFKKELK
jgi:hypothetical protein